MNFTSSAWTKLLVDLHTFGRLRSLRRLEIRVWVSRKGTEAKRKPSAYVGQLKAY